MQKYNKAKAAHHILSNATTMLHIDDVLASMEITHCEYRRWLRAEDLPLPSVTKQLCEEIVLARDIEDATLYAISATFSVSTTTVCAILNDDYRGVDQAADDVELQILDALRGNVDTQKNLAIRFNTTAENIQRIRRKHGVAPQRKTRVTLTADIKQRIIADKATMTVEEVMHKYNISRPTVFNIWRS